MTNQNAYEKLYNDMRNQFTVVSNDRAYSLGDYMSMKANAKETALPVAKNNSTENHSVAAVFSYVNDKFSVKKAPVKDKTLRAFPFRTSAAAFLSALVACALIFSYGIFTIRTSTNTITAADADNNTSEAELYESNND